MRLIWDKKTGQPEWRDEAEATTGIRSGDFVPVNEDEYHIVNEETGYVSKVDPQELSDYLTHGWQLADEKTILEHQQKDRPFAAAALGAANLVVGGALPAAAQMLDELELTENLGPQVRAIREQNPEWTAGEILTAVASLPAAGIRGTGVAAEAARALTAFPRAAAQAGEKAAEATARMLGTGTLVKQAVASGVRGAVEGSFYGAAHGVGEADIGDPKDVAEHILAGAGQGAVWGGGAMTAVPILGRMFTATAQGTGRGLAKLWEGATGSQAASGVAPKLQDALIAVQKKFNPGKADVIDEVANAETRAKYFGPDPVPDFAKSMAKDFDESEQALDSLVDFAWSGKLKNVGRLIKSPNDAAVVNAASDKLQDISALANRIDPGPLKLKKTGGKRFDAKAAEAHAQERAAKLYDFGDQAVMAGRLRAVVKNIPRSVGDATADAPRVFEGMLQLRKDLDEFVDWDAIKAGLPRTRQERNLDEALIAMRKDVADFLEREDLWGPDAAGLQRELNLLHKEQKETTNFVRQNLMVHTRKGANVGAYKANPDAFEKLLRDPSLNRNFRKNEAFTQRAATQKRAAAIVEKYYEGGAEASQALSRLSKKLDGSFDEVDRILVPRHQAEAMMKAEQEGALTRAMRDRFAPVLVGGMVAGWPGALASIAVREGIDAAMNPVSFWGRMAKISNLKLSTQTHVKNRVVDFFSDRPAKIVQGLRRTLTPTTVALADGGDRGRRALVSKIAEVNQYVQNPGAVEERVRTSMGDAADVAPNITAALAVQILRNLNYMAQVAPPPTNFPTLFGQEPMYSDSEIAKFAREMAVAEDPLIVLDRMYEGRLTLDETNALQAMYPVIYQEIQDGIHDYIMEKGPEIPYNKRLQLGILFRMPTDPSLLPDQMLFYQQATMRVTQQEQQAQQGRSRAVLRSASTKRLVQYEMSDLDRIAGGVQ
jgi:hypothetical protein